MKIEGKVNLSPEDKQAVRDLRERWLAALHRASSDLRDEGCKRISRIQFARLLGWHPRSLRNALDNSTLPASPTLVVLAGTSILLGYDARIQQKERELEALRKQRAEWHELSVDVRSTPHIANYRRVSQKAPKTKEKGALSGWI
jgi:hypothetical protein